MGWCDPRIRRVNRGRRCDCSFRSESATRVGAAAAANDAAETTDPEIAKLLGFEPVPPGTADAVVWSDFAWEVNYEDEPGEDEVQRRFDREMERERRARRRVPDARGTPRRLLPAAGPACCSAMPMAKSGML